MNPPLSALRNIGHGPKIDVSQVTVSLIQWIIAAAMASGVFFVWLKAPKRPQRQPAVSPPVPSTPTYLQKPMVQVDNGQIRVTKILVHPIKSCRGTSVREVRYTPQGLENDRKWAVLDSAENKILTARELPRLVLVEPELRCDASSPTKGKLVVTVRPDSGPVSFAVPIEPTPDMLSQWEIVSDTSLFDRSAQDAYIVQSLSRGGPSPSQILSDFLGRPVHLIVKGPTPRSCLPTHAFPTLKATAVFQDGYPVLFASEESLEAVAQAVNDTAKSGPDSPGALGKIGGMDHARWEKEKVPIERFRPNIVVRGAGTPFSEDIWEKVYVTPRGSNTKDESRSFTLVSRCARCLLPNVDPATGVRDAAVPYKVISKFRTGVAPEREKTPCFGSNAVPGGNGIIRVGDQISVVEWVQSRN